MKHWHVTWKQRTGSGWYATMERYDSLALAEQRGEFLTSYIIEQCGMLGCLDMPDVVSGHKDMERKSG